MLFAQLTQSRHAVNTRLLELADDDTIPHVFLQVLKDGDDFDPQDPGSDQDEGDDDSSLYERVLLDLTEASGEPADISRRLTVWT